MKQISSTLFRGVCTALATPFLDGGIDWDALAEMIEEQIAGGVSAICVCGTTGEAATLSDGERLQLVARAAELIDGRVDYVVGVGSPSTSRSVSYARFAAANGADALLVVTPYYNKATQNGLVAHFTAVADVSAVPVILYNVPSRTGCNILPGTAAQLAKHPNIVAIKEATGNMAQMVELRALCGDQLDIYSGEDALTVPMMAMGAKGTISVLSDVIPRQAVEMTDACRAGDFEKAAALQWKFLPLINALFSQVNPIPAKAAASAMGFGREYLRLPLTPMEDAPRAVLLEEMRKLGVRV